PGPPSGGQTWNDLSQSFAPPFTFLTRLPPPRSLLEHDSGLGRAYCTHRALYGADTPARTRLMNASSSSSEWKCVICPETICSAPPSQASGTPGGWSRNHTTNARSVESGSGGWGIDGLLQAPVQAGHLRVVHGMPGRYTTPSVQDHLPSVQMEGHGVTEAFILSPPI